jgi:alpha-beta hydrolase superfamily lysophospholipase
MSERQPSNARFLVIQGKDDTTVDWPFNIPFIERLFPQAVIHYLKDARHHLVNESEGLRKTIFEILNDWLDRQ